MPWDTDDDPFNVRDRALRVKIEPCPMTYAGHDTTHPIYGPVYAQGPRETDRKHFAGVSQKIIGYSCNKCHKTWDKNWVATWDKP